MYLKEIKLSPVKYQEIFLTENDFILNVFMNSEGQAILLVESHDEPNDILQETESCGVFLLRTGEVLPEDIAEQYRYISTLNMYSEIGSIVFHVYLEASEYTELEEFLDDELGF